MIEEVKTEKAGAGRSPTDVVNKGKFMCRNSLSYLMIFLNLVKFIIGLFEINRKSVLSPH